MKNILLILIGVTLGYIIAILTDYPNQSLVYRLGEINTELDLQENKITPLTERLLESNKQRDSLRALYLKKEVELIKCQNK
tara:strand:+ start:1325 stop:1567 length:243 start_codon:yes stop_codon:yes gene_type:complete